MILQLNTATYIRVITLFILFGFLPTKLSAEERQYLFGDWDGRRTALEEQGISIQSVLTYDIMSNTKGGIKTGTAGVGNYNFTTNADLEKLDLIKGGTLFSYVIGSFGGPFSSKYVGDFQYVDNIDTISALKLYEFWYQQNFLDDSLSFLIGLHEYNSEFDVLNYGINLLNSSFGLGADITQTPPSTFPTTTLGARIRVEPTENTYALVALYDGLAGDPNHPRRSSVEFESNDGLFSAYEAGFLEDSEISYKKIAVGGWYSTREYEDFKGNTQKSNGGIYLIDEAKLIDEGQEDAQGLGFFNALGFAKADRNQIGFMQALGLHIQV